MDERTKNLFYFVCSSIVLEKRWTISEEENRLFFSSFCMTKRKIFCPFYFYKMGRWRLPKANRHNPKGIKGENPILDQFINVKEVYDQKYRG